MRFRVFIEPQQGASYQDQLVVAQAAERLGFDAFFRSDHYLAMGVEGLPGPTDSWITLGAIARETETIRLGTLVNSVTFRHPGVTAISVAQVDQMSGGRAELGMGAGWFEQEHLAYGIPFPAKRFGLLAEQLEIITGMWQTPIGERYGFTGEHYTIVDSPALPKPTNPHGIPVIVGGSGQQKTPALAARFASEYNVGFVPFDDLAAPLSRVRAACEAIDRDPDDLVYSLPRTMAVGETEAEARRRAEWFGRSVETLAATGLAGTVQQVVDKVGELQRLGFERLYTQVYDLSDLDHLELIAREVMPHFAD